MGSPTLRVSLLTTSVFMISIVLTNSSPSALVRSENVGRERAELLKILVGERQDQTRPEDNTREKRGAKDKVKKVVEKAGQAVRQKATKENVKKIGNKIIQAARKNPEKTKKVLKKIGKLGAGKIVGIVIGVIVLIVIIGLAYYWYKKQQMSETSE